jgi:Spy/CpxP family protein refolding chaperone
MKTSKWFGLILAAILGVGGLPLLNAHAANDPAPQDRGALRGRFLERAKQKLGVTDDQGTQIKAVLKTDKDILTRLLSRLHEARGGLRAAIQAPDASEASVRAASAKVASVEADLAVERMKLFGKLSPILTAEQREKLKEFQSRMDDFVDSAIGRLGERLAE